MRATSDGHARVRAADGDWASVMGSGGLFSLAAPQRDFFGVIDHKASVLWWPPAPPPAPPGAQLPAPPSPPSPSPPDAPACQPDQDIMCTMEYSPVCGADGDQCRGHE